MHIHAAVYQCTLNVFDFFHLVIYTPIVLTLFPQHIFQVTSPRLLSLSLSLSYTGGGTCCGGMIYARMSSQTLRKQ